MPFVDITNMKEVRSWGDARRIIEEWKITRDPRWAHTWPAGTAPLDTKTKRHVALEDTEEGSYQAVFYRTAMATFWENGHIKLRVPQTVADHQFMWRVAPRGVSFMRVGKHTYCKYTITLNETHSPYEKIFLPRSNMILFRTTPHGTLPDPSSAAVRIRAQLAYRRIPPLMKLVRPIIDWRRSIERIGLPKQTPKFTPHLTKGFAEVLLHDSSKWGFFLDYSADEILGEILKALDVLTFGHEEFTHDVYKGPPQKWLARLPQLRHSHELKFI